MKRNVAAIVLAAGSSSRMGTAKQLLRVGSSTLLRRSVEQAIASNVRATFVVIGAEAEKMCDALRGLAVTIVENPRWAEGVGSSLSAGVRAVADQRPQFDTAMVITCDQPHVSAATLDSLIAEQEASGKPMVASGYGDTLGVPALFARQYFNAVLNLARDKGAKDVLLQHPDDVAVVVFEPAAVDLDTPAEYDRFLRGGGATS